MTVTLLLVTTETAAEPLGLRARQKQARRAALVDAAQLLVGRHGLDAVTVEAICAEAGVSARTFFNYFETKDDAVLGMEPLSLDTAVGEAFAEGGPTGVLATDLQALARSILVAPVMSRQRLAAADESRAASRGWSVVSSRGWSGTGTRSVSCCGGGSRRAPRRRRVPGTPRTGSPSSPG